MGVLIIAGTVTLVVLVVQRAGGATAPVAATPSHLGQPAGSRMVSLVAVEGRLAVLVARPDGTERLVLVDAMRGRVVGEMRAAE
jgi:hypothetical protein